MTGIGPALIGATANVGGGLLNMMVGNKRQRDAFEQNKRLMGIQYGNEGNLMQQQYANQQNLNQQGKDLQMEMWKETNYPAQMKMLKEAGLNPGLLYGMSGGGGTTTGSQGGGSASGGSASGGSAPPYPQMDIGNIVQGAKTAAEIALLKAQENKTNAEANVIEPKASQEIAESKGRITKMAQEEANAKIQGELLNIDKQIHTIEYHYTEERLSGEMERIWEDVERLQLDNKMKIETWESAKYDIVQSAIGKEIDNRLKESNISVNETQIQKMTADIVAKYKEIAQKDRELDQRDKDLIIRDFAETLKADHPNVWNVIGGGIKHSIDFIDDVLSFKNPDARYYDTPERNRYRGNNRWERNRK